MGLNHYSGITDTHGSTDFRTDDREYD
jgi:hypothetical protein